MTGDHDGNLDGDGLLLRDDKEVDMEAVVLDRMELELMDDGCVSLSVVKLDVDDVGGGSVGDSLEVLVRDCEKDVLNALAIEVARNKTLLADGFDDGFVTDLTDLAVDLEMLHCSCTLLKCVTQPRAGRGPIAPKAPTRFLSGRKDRN